MPSTIAYEICDSQGQTLSSKNSDQALIPASNTKLLWSLLALEKKDAIEAYLHEFPPQLEIQYCEKNIDSKGHYSGTIELINHGSHFFDFRHLKNPLSQEQDLAQQEAALQEKIATIKTQLNKAGIYHISGKVQFTCNSEFLQPNENYLCASYKSFNDNTIEVHIRAGEVRHFPTHPHKFRFIADSTLNSQKRLDQHTIAYNPNKDSTDYWRVETAIQDWCNTQINFAFEQFTQGFFEHQSLPEQMNDKSIFLKNPSEQKLRPLMEAALKLSDNVKAEKLALLLHQYTSTPSSPLRYYSCAESMQNASQIYSQFQIYDGCGLSHDNLVSCLEIVDRLSLIENLTLGAELRSMLSRSGHNGTLKKQYLAPSLKGKIFAKTGTLSGVHSLAGFYQKNGTIQEDPSLYFAFISNDVKLSRSGFQSFVQRKLEALI